MAVKKRRTPLQVARANYKDELKLYGKGKSTLTKVEAKRKALALLECKTK